MLTWIFRIKSNLNNNNSSSGSDDDENVVVDGIIDSDNNNNKHSNQSTGSLLSAYWFYKLLCVVWCVLCSYALPFQVITKNIYIFVCLFVIFFHSRIKINRVFSSIIVSFVLYYHVHCTMYHVIIYIYIYLYKFLLKLISLPSKIFIHFVSPLNNSLICSFSNWSNQFNLMDID